MRTNWTISCVSCQKSWTVTGGDSDYEREAVESRPCPHCLSYTLCRIEPAKPRRARPTFRLPIQKARPRLAAS